MVVRAYYNQADGYWWVFRHGPTWEATRYDDPGTTSRSNGYRKRWTSPPFDALDTMSWMEERTLQWIMEGPW